MIEPLLPGSTRAVAALLEGGDPVAAAVIADAGVLLGRALAGLVTALDVERVVVGGGVAQMGVPLLAPLAAALRDEVLPSLADVPVVPAELGTDAPLVGAALLATDLLGDARSARARIVQREAVR